ncbi:MAG: hypothetical protein KDK51_10190, partial [Deltaproteobacteria bacterium]|nr:hypothetical protein [Deltaproteobacteria bacterium]
PNFAVQLRLLEDDPTDTWPEGMTPCKVGAEIWIQVHSRKITQYASYSSLVPFNPATPDYRVLNPAQWAKPMSNEVTNTPAQISNLEIMHIDDQNVCVSYQKKRNLKRYYPGFPNYYVLELDFDSQRNCRRFHMFYDSSRPGVNIEGAKNIFLQSRIWQD